MTLQFRRARPGDLDRLLEIHLAAFPDPRGSEARRRNFVANPFGLLDDLHVATAGGILVAHAFLFAFEGWFGARPVPMAAIASVGVAPEARGRGIAGAILGHLHGEALARGDAISLLYPFRQGFYARHGYAAVSATRRLGVSPPSIPRAWRILPEGMQLRAATGADRAAITQTYLRAAARTTGWITRPATLWDARFLDERRQWIVVERGGTLVGYTSFSLSQEEAHAKTTLDVHEIVADDESARRALFGCIGAQKDQVTEALLDLASDDPIDRAFVDADAARQGNADIEHALGVVAGGPMVRIVDTTRSLCARGYLASGALDLAIAGEPALHLAVSNATATVGPPRGGPSISLDRTTLGAIAFGALRPSDAARLGWLEADDPRTLSAADALFALPPFFSIDPF